MSELHTHLIFDGFKKHNFYICLQIRFYGSQFLKKSFFFVNFCRYPTLIKIVIFFLTFLKTGKYRWGYIFYINI